MAGKRTFASIEQLPSKRWRVKYTAPDGIRRSAPHTFDTRLTAEAWVVATRRKIDKDQWDATDDNPREAVTFGVYAGRWLENRQVAGRPIKERTREHYDAILDDHLLPTFGQRQVAAIRPKDVRDWYAETLVGKPTMRSHSYSLLRTIMASAVADELIDVNPARIVGAGRTKRVHKIRPASAAELATLTAEMPDRLQLMVTLASWCALRFGETVELRRGDITIVDADDPQDSYGIVRVERAAVRTKGAYTVTTPKSDAGIRDVDIPPHVIPLIKAHLAKFVGSKRDSMLFPAVNGGHLQPSTVSRHWYRARSAAGREDLRWHDLRHSGAVIAAVSGATLAELQQRLGHSTSQAAMRYQHVAAGRSREVAALMSKLADATP